MKDKGINTEISLNKLECAKVIWELVMSRDVSRRQ